MQNRAKSENLLPRHAHPGIRLLLTRHNSLQEPRKLLSADISFSHRPHRRLPKCCHSRCNRYGN